MNPQLPIIDIAGLRTGDPAAKREVARQLHRACSNIGFFYIENHGVDQTLIEQTFEQAQRFFELPVRHKLTVNMADSELYRGYSGLLEEVLDPAAGGDLKESMNLGLDRGPDDPLVKAGTPLHGPNLWPEDLPGWRLAIQHYFDTMLDLSATLARGLALSLDLPEDFFADKIDQPMPLLRLLRYPPHPDSAPAAQMGAGAHTDYGLFAILAQDRTGGLEVRNAAGEWLRAQPIPDTFVVNLGDMTARWTNDRYQSTPHRVLNNAPHRRHSIAFFFDPNFHALVECLPTCLAAGETPRYPSIKAGEHIIERFSSTYVYESAKSG